LLSDLRAKESEFGSLEASSRKEAEALQAKLEEAWRGRSEAESGLVEARAALNESQGLAGREAAALAAEVTRLREVATAEGKAAAGQIANLRSELAAAEEDRRRVEHSLQVCFR
jgi:predicted  nucleic acid-binding Zn-ribbon protein